VVKPTERTTTVLNLTLLGVGYLTTGPWVLSCLLFASAKRSSFEEWALFAWPFVASIVLWLVGLIVGISLYRWHRWAAIRTARYCVIVVAGIASVVVGSLLVKTTAQWVQHNYL
jgi:hypothetical protein